MPRLNHQPMVKGVCTGKELVMRRFLLLMCTTVAAAFLCSGAIASPRAEKPAVGKQVAATEADAPADAALSGKVVETMNSGGYSYVCLEKNGKKTWVAVPAMQVKVGQEMSFRPGANMGKFTSKTLNRTFDSIIFSEGPMTPGAGGGAPMHGLHAGNTGAAAASNEKISVEKASGPDAYTVGEIFEKRATLNEKTAVVKAKVVKVSEGIMGKNWIHLQDGTGDAALKTNKLIATSQDLPAIGDVVTVKGTIYKDKDFGSGYRYAVIMEKASIQH